MVSRFSFLTRGLFLFFSLFLLSSCNEDLNLRDDFPEPYTLYGVLSPDLDTQYVRVYPIDEFPRLDQEVPGGIHFSSIHLETGEEIVWADTIDVAPNGQQDIVFKAPFKPEYGQTYRVIATRIADGARTHAEVYIPPMPDVRFVEDIRPPLNEAFLRFLIEGERIRVLKPDFTYTVFYYDIPFEFRGATRSYQFPYHRVEQRIENGWEVPVNLWTDRLYVQNFYNLDEGTFEGIKPYKWVLVDVKFDMIVGNDVWDPPYSLLDPNLLSHPDILHNVENGLGFVGGGYRIQGTYIPSCDLITDAQYLCPEVVPDDTEGM